MSDIKKFNELYKELAKIDINKDGYISWKDTGKGKSLGYLQWAIAEELFLSVYDDYDFIVKDFGNGKNYYCDDTGAYVETTIIAKKDGVEYKKSQQLQILDDHNEPQKSVDYTTKTNYGDKKIKAFTMDDIENTIQRCKVKNFHQFGLGAALYQGKIKQPTHAVQQNSSPSQKQQCGGKGEPVDIFVIEEILQTTPSTKGLNAQKIYDKFEAQNWWNVKSNKPITAENIKFGIEKGWL